MREEVYAACVQQGYEPAIRLLSTFNGIPSLAASAAGFDWWYHSCSGFGGPSPIFLDSWCDEQADGTALLQTVSRIRKPGILRRVPSGLYPVTARTGD